jgi:putative transposase
VVLGHVSLERAQSDRMLLGAIYLLECFAALIPHDALPRSRQPRYGTCRRPPTTSARSGGGSARQVQDERLSQRIGEVHEANYCACGYRRMWKALRRAGEDVDRGRVQRLMRQAGIQGAKRRGKPWRTTTPDPAAARRADLVNRDFTASRPNELWLADFSYLRCWEGLVFFSFVIDVYSRMVVGWQFAKHMRTTLVLDALQMALSTRERVDEVRLVHHSDRGSQYVSGDYTQTL